MNNEEIENVSDRELSLELFDNPINPLLTHIVPSFVDKKDPMFYLQINGEANWKWRGDYRNPRIVLDLLQRSILHLGYELIESSR